MSLADPIVELFHQTKGTISPYQRELAERVRATPAPRPEKLGEAIGALLAPWWGFAAYFCVYALLVMSIVALFAAAILAGIAHKLHLLRMWDEMDLFWPSLLLTAPFSSLPFRHWVRRKRGELVDVASKGTLVVGRILTANVVTVHGAAHSTHLSIDGGDAGSFRGYVGKAPSWAVPGQAVTLVEKPSCGHAVLLAPDGALRPLTRS